MKTGRAASAHSGQRVTKLFSEFTERAVAAEWSGWRRIADYEQCIRQYKVEEWRQAHTAPFLNELQQCRTVVESPFPDEIPITGIGTEETREAEVSVRRIV